MTSNKEIADVFSKEMGLDYGSFIGMWDNKYMFIPSCLDESLLLGPPHLALVDKGEVRFATCDEADRFCQDTGHSRSFIQFLEDIPF